MKITDKIRELCSEKQISIPKLEETLGFGSGTISKWKQSAPSSDKLVKVADYLHVTTDYLLGRTEIKTDVITKIRSVRASYLDEVVVVEICSKHENSFPPICDKLYFTKDGFLIGAIENTEQGAG